MDRLLTQLDRKKGFSIVIAILGNSCTGKSTIAELLAQRLSAEVYSGKDYLRLARSEAVAAMLERKYGQFEDQPHNLRVDTDVTSAEEAVEQIMIMLGEKVE